MVSFYQKKVLWLVGLGVLILVGAALRAWGLSSISLDVDEAITLSAAQGWLATGTPVIQASGLYYGRDILGTLTTLSSIALFGTSEWAARLPMLLMGVVTIPLTYVLARQLKMGELWSWVAALGVALSQWGIYFAHSARMYQEQQFFVVLTTLAGVWTLQQGWNWKRALVTSTLAVMAVLAHRSAVIILPILLGVAVWTRRKPLKFWLTGERNRLWLWGGLLLGVVGLLIGEWRWDLVSVVWHYIVGTDKNPFRQMQLRLVPFKHLFRTYPVWLLGMLLAWIWARGRSAVQLILGFTWGVLISVDLLIYPSEPNYRIRYFYDIMPLFFVLSAFSFDQLWSWSKTRLKRPILFWLISILFILVLSVQGSTLRPASVYTDQPEWNRLRGLMAPVVIAHPTAPADYYLGHVEYWLVSHQGEIRSYSENNQDIYAGAAILLDPQELQQILTTQDGVVVLEVNRFAFISKDLRRVLKQYAQKDEELSTPLLQVWRF